MTLASLPMYDRPETVAVNDALWRAIRGGLDGDAPETLTRGGDLWQHWLHPDLVLSQTCGYPYRARLHGKVTLVATPDPRLPGCPPGHYRSLLVARRDDPRDKPRAFAGARLAYNDALSQSGWAAPWSLAQAEGFAFGPGPGTGSHAASARAVAAGAADIAAIDAVTWGLVARHDAMAQSLRVVGATAPTPALPFITARGRDPAPLSAALAAAIPALDPAARDAIGLHAVVVLPPEAYLAMPNPAPPAPADLA